MNCRENMCFPEKCRTHPGIKYWIYRMPNRSLNERKISDSPPFVGMRAGAAAGSWIEDYSLGIDSTILGTSNPPSPLTPVRHSFLNNFFVTETQYFSDMWGGRQFRISNSFQSRRNIRFFNSLPWSKVVECLHLLHILSSKTQLGYHK